MGKTVVVVGAINVDVVVTADRLPRPGETVVGPGASWHGGGKGANAAVAAARAGATVELVGAVGADDTGRSAVAELRAEGVGVVGVAVLDGVSTGVALIVVDAAGENQIAVGAGANSHVDPEWVRTALRRAAPELGCVLVSTEITGAAVAAAVRTAAELGVPCLLNPAPVIPEIPDLLRYQPLLTPNTGELADLAAALPALVPAPVPAAIGSSTVRRAVELATPLTQHTHRPVVVTLGGAGTVIVSEGGRVEQVAARAVTVRDTTGAGDTFNGVLAARLAAGDDLATAVRAANAAASLSVTAIGARSGMPTADAIDAALRD